MALECRRFRRVAWTLLPGAFTIAVLTAHAQDLFDRVPPDGQPWSIERAADIPPPLAAALAQAGCRQHDAMLLTFPIEIFRPAAGARPMAIVPCSGIVLHGRAFLFERGVASEPSPMAFPVMALPGRVSQSETPGFFSWDRAERTLVALNGNDVCEGTMSRHTYRYDPRHDGDDLNGFALVKLERGRLSCGGADHNWQVVWEAGAK